MTTQTEALKLALDYLYDHRMGGHVIAAIKKALAQPAVTESHKQEPVAFETVYETIIQWDEGGGKRSRRELARRIVSLYTTPPQRKPLTLEQLREHWQVAKVLDMTDAEIDFADYVLITRDVEALHGIKE